MERHTNIEFDQNLGQLFYAIAATDNCVKDEEIKTLERIINKDWLPINKNAASILETFKELWEDEHSNSERCFKRFVSFKRTHSELFNATLNSKILKTANAITTSFSGQNKSELIQLAKLDLELKKE
ncbi:hypothetical protein [Winogradskyella psychrotolerans]|uniref:hypothetical protein n=1 Tax=Winogradskyella psychrotolerans TaxID=1344585 RepID=UPI002091882D|nr:hypothetical protein [Winogradskyella psychrotolerans]